MWYCKLLLNKITELDSFPYFRIKSKWNEGFFFQHEFLPIIRKYYIARLTRSLTLNVHCSNTINIHYSITPIKKSNETFKEFDFF